MQVKAARARSNQGAAVVLCMYHRVSVSESDVSGVWFPGTVGPVLEWQLGEGPGQGG
jgi:hypothetical protein